MGGIYWKCFTWIVQKENTSQHFISGVAKVAFSFRCYGTWHATARNTTCEIWHRKTGVRGSQPLQRQRTCLNRGQRLPLGFWDTGTISPPQRHTVTNMGECQDVPPMSFVCWMYVPTVDSTPSSHFGVKSYFSSHPKMQKCHCTCHI